MGILFFLFMAVFMFFTAPSCSNEFVGCFYSIDPISEEQAFKYQIYHSLAALISMGLAIVQLVNLEKLIKKPKK